VRIPETIQLWSREPHDTSEGIDDFRDYRDFKIADVFTGNPLEGNQLGIFLDGRGLDSDTMLKATREMNYSESSSCHRSTRTRTPTCASSRQPASSRSPGIPRSVPPG
jgi:hypothetical protein